MTDFARDGILRLALPAVLAVSLQAAPAFAQSPADILLYKGADREQKLIEGARKEGQVVIYAAMIVKPLLWISTNVLWKAADVAGIDGAVNGIAAGTTAIGDGVRHTQSGNTRSYAVWVVVGALVVMAVIFFWPFGGKPVLGMLR